MFGHVNHAVVGAWGRQITYSRGATAVVITSPTFSAGQMILDGPDGPATMVREPEARVRTSDLDSLGDPRRNDTIVVDTGEAAGTYQVTKVDPDGTGMFRLSLRKVT